MLNRVIIFLIIFNLLNFNVNTIYSKTITSKIKIDNSINNIYIELEKFNIILPIVYGTSSDILDQNVVGVMETFNNFDKDKNTVLAAHNYINLFGKLHNMNIGDTINIISNKKISYMVKEKHIINDHDMSYFKQGFTKKLTLVTCTIDNKRLIVIAYPI